MIAFNNLSGIVALTLMFAGTLGSATPAPNPQLDDLIDTVSSNMNIDGLVGDLLRRAEEDTNAEKGLSDLLGLFGGILPRAAKGMNAENDLTSVLDLLESLLQHAKEDQDAEDLSSSGLPGGVGNLKGRELEWDLPMMYSLQTLD